MLITIPFESSSSPVAAIQQQVDGLTQRLISLTLVLFTPSYPHSSLTFFATLPTPFLSSVKLTLVHLSLLTTQCLCRLQYLLMLMSPWLTSWPLEMTPPAPHFSACQTASSRPFQWCSCPLTPSSSA